MWIGIGLGAEAVFGVRVLVQWIASERRRRSIVPPAYWYLSVVASAMLLTYAVHRLDPVFIAGETLAMLVFVRNIWLIRSART